MSLKINDSGEQRLIDRIKCIAFKDVKDSGAEFITRKWIAEKLKRSEKWVQCNWNKTEIQCFSDFEKCGRPLKLSQESRDIISASSGLRKQICAQVAREILDKR
jgi:hypothetical protein